MNTCNCPDPPGGQVVCDSDQIAICRVKNGRAEYLCISPPRAIQLAVERQGFDRGNLAVANWVLSVVTGEDRDPEQSLSGYDLHVLDQEQYETGDGTITFRLPTGLLGPLGAVQGAV